MVVILYLNIKQIYEYYIHVLLRMSPLCLAVINNNEMEKHDKLHHTWWFRFYRLHVPGYIWTNKTILRFVVQINESINSLTTQFFWLINHSFNRKEMKNELRNKLNSKNTPNKKNISKQGSMHLLVVM